MAKIGNEARLILKLAEERVEGVRTRRIRAARSEDTILSYDQACTDWRITLADIVAELEEGR